jgi:hypothetical protein
MGHMEIPGRFCLLVAICAVLELYKRLFKSFLGFLAMDCASCLNFLSQSNGFGCGFLVFGCSSQVFGFLELFLMFGLGIKVLQLGYYFLYHLVTHTLTITMIIFNSHICPYLYTSPSPYLTHHPYTNYSL